MWLTRSSSLHYCTCNLLILISFHNQKSMSNTWKSSGHNSCWLCISIDKVDILIMNHDHITRITGPSTSIFSLRTLEIQAQIKFSHIKIPTTLIGMLCWRSISELITFGQSFIVLFWSAAKEEERKTIERLIDGMCGRRSMFDRSINEKLTSQHAKAERTFEFVTSSSSIVSKYSNYFHVCSHPTHHSEWRSWMKTLESPRFFFWMVIALIFLWNHHQPLDVSCYCSRVDFYFFSYQNHPTCSISPPTGLSQHNLDTRRGNFL